MDDVEALVVKLAQCAVCSQKHAQPQVRARVLAAPCPRLPVSRAGNAAPPQPEHEHISRNSLDVSIPLRLQILPCMHSFCSACLAGERATEGVTARSCPVCGLDAAYAVDGVCV